ncbi:hypothetical protein UC35_08535 [Ramlibacter tataouinensis]|uniref:Uncharacterized protein n=2 Tax=Ramlibacter tataouinensis TaxID=94132 RepID=A0A127JSJ2_9BURK|nr:hypothetical protein UC35_08535 [Ramlibacter tataouinensis]
MKFLLLLAVVLVVIWFLRGGARRPDEAGREQAARRAAPPAPSAPQDMVECPVCHVHLPRADALPGPGGQLYCCAEHRLRGEG